MAGETGDPNEPKRPGAEPSERKKTSDPHRDVTGALHDVSNALTVMLGWVAEARAPFAKREAVAYALGIIEQRARIARDLARRAIGANPSLLDHEELLEATLGGALDALAVEASRVGVRLSRLIEGDAGSLRVGSAGDLSQILTNVVMNALAHAPPHSEVTITAHAMEQTILIDVQDEGPGVAPIRRESIFTGDSDREGGAGVGLRHARALARAAHGDLMLLDSKASGPTGALFRLSWPRAGVLPPPPTTGTRMRVLQGQRVLVIEDDADVTLLLEAALGARGATVTIARSAAELALAVGPGGGGTLDAALIDLSPIAGDVPGALEALRTASPGINLVVMTGSAEALPDAVSTESVRLVRKPFEVSEVVDALLEGRRAPK